MVSTIFGRAIGYVVFGIVILTAGVASAITIGTVPVRDAGNAPDSSGLGTVSYPYNIGTYEVTAGQYTAFLNAVASDVAQNDPYHLWNSNQIPVATGSGITRTYVSSTQTFRYDADPLSVNRPVNFVNLGDAMRFANWLANGQPQTGVADANTTEDGTYTLNGATSDGALNAVARNADWSWAVASEDEWYKAAYYQPIPPKYYVYPTGSDVQPGRDLLDLAGNDANYAPAPIEAPYYTTPAGQFKNSPSPYGTFDQGGNVGEWTETVVGVYREIRGGSFNGPASQMASAASATRNPTAEARDIGFRVTQFVPLPGAVWMGGVLLMALAAVRMRRGLSSGQ